MAMSIRTHFAAIFTILSACGGEEFEGPLFRDGGVETGGGAGAGVGGNKYLLDAGGAAGSGSTAGGGTGGWVKCGSLTCNAQFGCDEIICDGVHVWCRNFDGRGYAFAPQAVCGTSEYPYGTTFVCGEDGGSGVCCEKTNNWESSC